MIAQCMNMMGRGMMGAMIWPMLLVMLLIGVLGAGGMVLLIRLLSSGDSGTKSTALNILQERYARGELDHEDYRERRRLLETQL